MVSSDRDSQAEGIGKKFGEEMEMEEFGEVDVHAKGSA